MNNTAADSEQLIQELIRDIEGDIQACSKSANRNYVRAYTLLIIALIASVAATILASSSAPPGITAAVAATPGLVVLINSTLKFEQKSRYCWNRVRQDEAIVRKLKYEGAAVAEISHEFSEMRKQLEAEWPEFGTLPGKPVRGPDRPAL